MAEEKTAAEIKLPPHSLEAEQAVLGSLLIDKDAIIRIADQLLADDFYADKHRFVYDAMVTLYQRHDPIDIVSLSNLLQERQQLDSIGGRSYIVSLSNAVPTAANVVQYASIVAKKRVMARMIEDSPVMRQPWAAATGASS